MIRCIIIPTTGIHPTSDVMIPETLPIIDPLTLFVNISATMCSTSIKISGVHALAIIYAPPRIGNPSSASNIPVTHFKIRDMDNVVASFISDSYLGFQR